MHSSWINLMNEVDVIHVLADWTKDMLLNQGINSKKLNLLELQDHKNLSSKKNVLVEDDIFETCFWGRCNPQKGIHLSC